MRVLASVSLLGIVLATTSCPSFGANARKLEPSAGPLVASLQNKLADAFVAKLAAEPPEDELEAVFEDPIIPLPPVVAANDWGTLDDSSEGDKGDPGKDAADDDTDAESAARIAHEQDEVADTTPRLASIAHETWVYEAPRRKSRRIGYLRAGAVVTRSAKPEGFAGCKGGFYKVAPRGYVCLGRSASLDPFHPVVEAAKTRPRRDRIPYDYVLSRTPGPVMYTRLPSDSEQAREETDLGFFKRQLRGIQADKDYVPLPEAMPMPNALLYGGALPQLGNERPRPAGTLVSGHAGIRSGFALLSQFDHEGRRFGLTTDLAVIPLDRTRWVKPATFQGTQLAEEITLPVAFVMRKKTVSFERDELGRMQTRDEPLLFRQALALTGKKERGFLETTQGSWVKEADVRVIEKLEHAPTWAKDGRKWIDVSILKQSLVAYEGTKPVYVTLVSTGAGGLGDPKTTHATVQGVFLIHTKHLTVTMDGDEAGDQFDLRDVPFVQYFNEGYALHAAYWHDEFGTPRSHGCVNLAPNDAAWLFGWTTPDVPEGWHGALTLKHGTLVYTHP